LKESLFGFIFGYGGGGRGFGGDGLDGGTGNLVGNGRGGFLLLAGGGEHKGYEGQGEQYCLFHLYFSCEVPPAWTPAVIIYQI